MKKITLSIIMFLCCTSVHASVWVPYVVTPSDTTQIIIQQPAQIIQQPKPLVREIQYFLVPHVIEITKPVIKRGVFGRLYIIEEKSLETYNVWQPVEVWK